MEKLSGILPPSPRMKVLELSKSQPVRPGAPSYGRPMGKNSIGDRITLSKELEDMRMNGALPVRPEPSVYKNTEARKAQVIEDLNRRFFSNAEDVTRDKQSIRESDLNSSEQALSRVEEVGPFILSRGPTESHAPLESTIDKSPSDV